MTTATATATLNLVDVIAFINGATDADLDRISQSVNHRHRALANERAAAITVGMKGVLSGLRPKYLNGLSGTVTAISGDRATVTLDEESTNTLRWAGRRYYIAPNVKEYDLAGVPLSCIDHS